SGVDVGGDGKKGNPEKRPAVNVEAQHIGHQIADGSEITNKSYPGPEGNQQPQGMFKGFFARFGGAHGFFIELDPGITGAFHTLFDPHKNKRPGRLRTGITTPDTTGKVGNGKQSKGRNNQ